MAEVKSKSNQNAIRIGQEEYKDFSRGFRGNGVGNTQDFCRLCEDEEELETVEHILCHCPRLQSLRLKWLAKGFHDELGDLIDN
ncbi:hypothetical protein FF38_05433 [Lucilia cuprina]|uniref:Reverse transcriptase zinc-binding domain-containing protein n=1 Tax=Lucilia cuprina TaxID=7375 RepID=A0A0L0BXF8_LUCCU|nr:hypothetical protein FF38_05433 [Lucilia cuprina]